MKYKWTLIGFLLGLFTRRPQLIVLASLIGFVIDSGWLGGSFSKSTDNTWRDPEPLVRDPYQILEVDPQASDDDIEAAYRRQIAQYHPDKVAGAAKEIRELADKRASEINSAYDQIQKIRGKK
ncbi:MAG: DnaJ domain-containing protein [Arenimonas sp.]